jgi:thiamine-monophosphate kinase
MIDVSDGLASEVRHICEASGCGASVFANDIPINERTAAAARQLEEDATDYALYGGEEYELLFTIRPDDRDDLLAADADFSIIGTCTDPGAEPRIIMHDGVAVPLLAEGFRHF